jgi:hypothetical protein
MVGHAVQDTLDSLEVLIAMDLANLHFPKTFRSNLAF